MVSGVAQAERVKGLEMNGDEHSVSDKGKGAYHCGMSRISVDNRSLTSDALLRAAALPALQARVLL